MHDRESPDGTEKMVGRNMALKVILVRAQKGVKSTVEKSSIVLKNTYIFMDRILTNMNVKGTSGNVSTN